MKKNNKNSNIDIICPLYNAEKYIKRLNNSLLNQKKVNINKIKYILTRSNDGSEDILKEEKLKYEIIAYKIIEKKDFSHSLVREKAAYESRANIVVFISQDIIIEDELWLYYLVRDIENDKCDASYSRQICKDNSLEKYTRELNYPKKSSIVTKKDIDKLQLRTFFFSDAASAIKRDVFIKLNGYDGKRLPINEDMYIAYKLIMSGYRIKYCSTSLVTHSHDFNLKELFNRYYLIGRFFKENSYLNNYKVNNSGLDMAKFVLKRSIQDKNGKVLLQFVPNMCARFIGMKLGKLKK